MATREYTTGRQANAEEIPNTEYAGYEPMYPCRQR